jgi:alpha-amylase
MRRGNVDLNKYIQSTVQPSSWKSSNKKIAEVNAEGLMTIKKSGSVKLTAAFPAKKGMKVKKLTISLKIKMPGFKKSSYSVKAGKSKKTKTVNTTGAAVTYRIEDASIATVDENGTITGIAKGTTKLIMTVNKIDYSTKVKVK